MSFYGKKFKKSGEKNLKELLDALNANDRVRAMLNNTESLSSFSKNADGTLQYVLEHNGAKVLDQTITLGKEFEMPSTDGTPAKNVYTMNGDVISVKITHSDDHVVNISRKFEGNKMTVTFTSSRTDLVAEIYYEAV